jgi:hypothetical protein
LRESKGERERERERSARLRDVQCRRQVALRKRRRPRVTFWPGERKPSRLGFRERSFPLDAARRAAARRCPYKQVKGRASSARQAEDMGAAFRRPTSQLQSTGGSGNGRRRPEGSPAIRLRVTRGSSRPATFDVAQQPPRPSSIDRLPLQLAHSVAQAPYRSRPSPCQEVDSEA